MAENGRLNMKSLLSLCVLLVCSSVTAQESSWFRASQAQWAASQARSDAARVERMNDMRNDAIVRALNDLEPPYYSRGTRLLAPPTVVPVYDPPVFQPRQKWQRHYHMRDRQQEYKRRQLEGSGR
jgi:hypothetical protein